MLTACKRPAPATFIDLTDDQSSLALPARAAEAVDQSPLALPARAAQAVNSVLPRAADLVKSLAPAILAQIEALHFAWMPDEMTNTRARVDFNPDAAPGQPLYDAFVAECKAHPELTVRIGFHGTLESNVTDICRSGLDPSRRRRQALGFGEYFSIEPRVAFHYALSASAWSGAKPQMGISLADKIAEFSRLAASASCEIEDVKVKRATAAAKCLPMGGRVIIFALLSDGAPRQAMP